MECPAKSINPSAPSLPGKSGRFVLLWHKLDHIPDRQSHFDLMIEHIDEFVTLELLQWPNVTGAITARFLPAHRLAYWDLEGPISGNRGKVTRLTRGTFETIVSESGFWKLSLSSDELRAEIELNWNPPEDSCDILKGGIKVEIVANRWSTYGISDPLAST